MRLSHFKTTVFSTLLLTAACVAVPSAASAASKNVMCLKTNSGQYIELARVSMIVIADGKETFEVVVRDGAGAAGVKSVSFEKHASDIDLSKYQMSSDGTPSIDLTKPIWLIADNGKYYKMKDVKEFTAIEGTNQFFLKTSAGEEKVKAVKFFRGTEADLKTGIQQPAAMAGAEEKLRLSTEVSSSLTIYGCGKAPRAVVYSANGQQVAHAPVANGCSTVQVAHLPAGVYIVKVGNKSLKFLKK